MKISSSLHIILNTPIYKKYTYAYLTEIPWHLRLLNRNSLNAGLLSNLSGGIGGPK